jgi:hypothetical protein
VTSELSEGQKQLIALARFVLEFAQAEEYVVETLWALGNVSDELARAAMSGVRADAAIGYINRLFELRGVKEADRTPFPEVFKHFSDISKTRNLILHHGLETGGVVGTYTSDGKRALTLEKMRYQRISTEILNQMTDDLAKVTSMLIVEIFKAKKERLEIDRYLTADLQRPWLYTPTPPLHQTLAAARKNPS